jgi:hypothetical protein
VLKRNRGARLALTVLAVPLFLSGLVAGGFLSSLVAAAAAMLWLEPARDWFNGKAPRAAEEERPRPRPEAGRQDPPEQGSGAGGPDSPGGVTGPAPSAGPRPHQGFGSVPSAGPGSPPSAPPYPSPYAAPGPPAQHAPYPAPQQSPYPPAQQAWPQPSPQVRRRPGAVVAACVLTWVFASLAALLMSASALVVAASPDLVLDEVHRQNPELAEQGVTGSMLQAATYVTAGVVAVWSLVAILLAVLAFRRSRWARVALLVSSAAAAVACLVASLGSLLMVVPVFACVATFSLLLKPEVRAWFAAP